MSAESLARWADALFGGSILSESSMTQMLTFVDAKYGMAKYGLGVALFKRRFFTRPEAIGHSGGNIGATTYMVYLPVYDATMVVMINRFDPDSIGDILWELVELVVNDTKLHK
jgi:CubicO group peptidase (beta-lactamase class C family)